LPHPTLSKGEGFDFLFGTLSIGEGRARLKRLISNKEF
jgi:hypothetical protein